jgi:ABC-type spermidine/putrescine transport system permease subunit I
MTAPAGRTATSLLLLPALALLGLGFAAPLARLAGLSFSAAAGPFAAYRTLLGNAVYYEVFARTIGYALAVTAIDIAAGYILALSLTLLSPARRRWLFVCVLLPLWVSVLVRSFAWMLLLERRGPVNRLLLDSGLISAPLPLLFNSFSVLVGMTHLLLPYAVLPIYAALVRIDPSLLRASEGLGAGPLMTFRRVLLPLSAQGVGTAATFLFLLSLGFFVTPALLGGAADITLSMLIESFVNEQLNWPLAAAASMLLLAATFAMLAIGRRFAAAATFAEVR